MGNGKLAKGVDGVELLVIHRYIRMLPSFLGMATMWLAYGEAECWMRPAARYWFKYSIGLLGEDRVYAVGAGKYWSAVRRGGDLERNERARAKVSFGNIREFAEDVIDGGQPEQPWRSPTTTLTQVYQSTHELGVALFSSS